MKPINKEELYENLSAFLKAKGVSLQEGSYNRGIHAGCSFLADAINLSQAGLTRAKSEIEKQLDHARQIIHEKTAPKGTANSSRGKTGAKASAGNRSGSGKIRRKNPKPRNAAGKRMKPKSA